MNWNVIASVIITIAAWAVFHWLESRRFATRERDWEKQIAAYEKAIDRLYADNKDLRDRMYQSKAQPPSGVDLTQAYEERKEIAREQKAKDENSGKKRIAGPLERIVDKWKEKDLKAAAEKNIDLTEPQHRAN